MLVQRRLFWKIYLTLLASLVAAAFLIGAFWSLVGEGPREQGTPLHVELEDWNIPQRDDPPGAVMAALKRLSEEMNADVSVYDRDGGLVASVGRPIPLAGDRFAPRSRIIQIELPDARAVVARLRPPGPGPRLRFLSMLIAIAGGVGLAAFPVTARLTRRLEGLRSGVEKWGSGALSLRVDDTGDDEVAVVARTFNAAAARAEDLLKSQKALLANASHELRSPLARLRMAIELWLGQPGPAMQAEILRNLAESDQLVEEILLASRLDHAGPTIRGAERVDLVGLAAEEAARLEAGVACVEAGESPIEIEGDAKLLRRLIRNLLENAAKHGRPPVRIVVTGQEGGARLVVSDGGQGIPPSERERVFEPFYRPAGRSESSGGWGLGLSLVRQIAQRHGGAAFCEGQPGGGSRFVVDLATARGVSRGRADG